MINSKIESKLIHIYIYIDTCYLVYGEFEKRKERDELNQKRTNNGNFTQMIIHFESHVDTVRIFDYEFYQFPTTLRIFPS